MPCYAQIVIDITKHAVLGKFNDIRPGIYKEYMRDLCSDSLDKHSHNTHKLVRHIVACSGSGLGSYLSPGACAAIRGRRPVFPGWHTTQQLTINRMLLFCLHSAGDLSTRWWCGWVLAEGWVLSAGACSPQPAHGAHAVHTQGGWPARLAPACCSAAGVVGGCLCHTGGECVERPSTRQQCIATHVCEPLHVWLMRRLRFWWAGGALFCRSVLSTSTLMYCCCTARTACRRSCWATASSGWRICM